MERVWSPTFINHRFKRKLKSNANDEVLKHNKEVEAADLYIVGVPYQPCPMAGYRKDSEDATGHGTPIHNIIVYIDKNRVNIFVSEHLKGFTVLGGGKYAKQVVQALENIKEKALLCFARLFYDAKKAIFAYVIHH